MSGTIQFAQEILEKYPYPVAGPARNFNQTTDPRERFERLEFLAEMVVRYLGVIAVSNYLRDGVQAARIRALLGRLASPDWIVWLDLLGAILEHYHDQPHEFVIPELVSLLSTHLEPGSAISRAYQAIATARIKFPTAPDKVDGITLDDFFTELARNSRAGWAGLGDTEKGALVEVLFPAFVQLLEGLSFLMRYPLLYVAEFTSELDKYCVRFFMGDADQADSVEIRRMPEEVDLELLHVYLCDVDEIPLLGLEPLLIVVNQTLYILHENENNEQIVYIHCSTGEPYQPEAPGYSLGGIAVRRGTLDWLGQALVPGDLAAEPDIVTLDVTTEELRADLKEFLITRLGQERGTSAAEMLFSLVQQSRVSRAPGDSQKDVQRTIRASHLGREAGIRSVHLLEFSTRAYLAELGVAVEEIYSGSVLGPYRILGKIGEGPVADIFEAEHIRSLVSDDHRVILRILKQRVVEQVMRNIVDPRLRAWWLLSQQRHPNVLGLTMISKTRGNRFVLELEHFEGVPLSHLFGKKTGRFPIFEALDIVVQVCHALLAADMMGLVHGHLKPSNILVGGESHSHVKVTDFGMSTELLRYLLAESGNSFSTTESLAYLPPEYLDDDLDLRGSSDVYSVGVLLYHLLTGRLPFEDQSLEERRQRIQDKALGPVSIRSMFGDIPLELDRLVQRAMQPEPHRRYQRLESLLRELEAIERSHDAVFVVSRLLIDNVSAQALHHKADTLDIAGPDLHSRVVQYCLMQERLELALETWFGLEKLHEICTQRGLKPSWFSREECIAALLQGVGLRLPSLPRGLPQSTEKVKLCLRQVKTAPTLDRIDELIMAAAKECEVVLQDLLRFHAIFLFQDAWPQRFRRDVMGKDESWRNREDLPKMTLCDLLTALDRFNALVSGTSVEADSFRDVFQKECILTFPPRWKQEIPSARNKSAHFDRERDRKPIAQLRMIGQKFIKTILDLLELLARAGTHPTIVVVQEIRTDCYERRFVECLGDDGPHTVYTSQDVRPGDRYYYFSRSEPIGVDPILIRCAHQGRTK